MICSICNEKERGDPSEIWKTEDGTAIEVPARAEISVLDPRCPEDKIICEQCYRKGLLSKYGNEELNEIHFQFGLEYMRAQKLALAEAAIRKALKIKVAADSLASLAYCLSESDKVQAKNLYLLALDIEPNHFMARSNLQLLEKSTSSG